jgi:LysM repeat protein
MEVADLRHAVHTNEMEVKILEERLEFSEREVPDQLPDLKKKIALFEKTLDKMNNEIRSLTNYASQTSASFESYRQQITAIDHKLGEISKLRATLTKLSETPSSYEVLPGDSLQKIARKYHVSIDALKKENHLSSDKIFVGQKLLIPQ